MPAHAQQQVLDAVAATLVAAGTDAAARVFVDLADALQATELPAILVEELSDGEQIEGGLGDISQRTLGVRITCVLAGSVAQARTLGQQVEVALHAAGTPIAALAKGGIQLQASRPGVGPDADRLLSVREQDWQFLSFTTPQAPDVLI